MSSAVEELRALEAEEEEAAARSELARRSLLPRATVMAPPSPALRKMQREEKERAAERQAAGLSRAAQAELHEAEIERRNAAAAKTWEARRMRPGTKGKVVEEKLSGGAAYRVIYE
jgi:hypothetical protein